MGTSLLAKRYGSFMGLVEAARKKKSPAEKTAEKYTKALKKAIKDYNNLLIKLEVTDSYNVKRFPRQHKLLGARRDGVMFIVTMQYVPINFIWSVFNFQEATTWENASTPLIKVRMPAGDPSTVRYNDTIKFDIYVPITDAKVLTGKDDPSHADILRAFQPFFAKGAGKRVYPLGELPPIKSEGLNDPSKWKIHKLANGGFIYFPVIDVRKEADEYERDFYDRLQKWEEYRYTDLEADYPRPENFKFLNSVIYSDPTQQIMIYYSGGDPSRTGPRGQDKTRKVFKPIGASSYITARDIITLFEEPPSAVMEVMQQAKYNIVRLLQAGRESIAAALNKVENELTVKPDDENKLPKGVYKAKVSSPRVQLQVYAILKLLYDNIDKVDALKESLREEASALRKLTPYDVPPLPHWRKDFKAFPHQALTLARAARVDIFPAEIDMGGGKTMLMLYTALIKLMTGKVKRPLIVMPTKLISQQVNEMRNWTAGTVNIVALTSKAYATYGKEEYERLFKTAPPNTIFITSYEWLMNESTSVWDEGAKRFDSFSTRPVWLRHLGVDMVMLDESHKIKNNTSKTYKAVMMLADVPVKSVFSGTMISNNPADLIAQTSFLDPSMFGRPLDFYEKYVNSVGSGSQPVAWKEDGPKLIREKFIRNGGVMLSKAAWLSLLPDRTIKIHKVEMDPVVKASYQRILDRTIASLQEMLNDPTIPKKTRDRIEAFLKASEAADDSELPQQITQQLEYMRLFLTAPDIDPIIQEMEETSGVKVLSPKIKVINELLDKHFATDDGKVIIFVLNKAAAKHIKENIKYSDIALYYDASKKAALDEFKDNPNIKILVAVDMSLKEGFNLTHATRIIRAQLNWNMGDEEQSYGRAFRPGQKKHVNIDILVTDETVEVTMFARLVSKLHVNALVKTDYARDARLDLTIITMNLQSIRETNSFDDHLLGYIDVFNSIEKYVLKEAEEYAEVLGSDMLDVKRAQPVARRVIPVPTIPGATPPIDTSITLIAPPPNARSRKVQEINKANKIALQNIRKMAPLALANTVPFVLDDKQYNPPKPIAAPESEAPTKKQEKAPPQQEQPGKKKKSEDALPERVYVAFVLAGGEYGLRLYTKKPYPKLKPFGFQFFRKSKARVVSTKVGAVQAIIHVHNAYDGGVCDAKLMGKRIKVLPVPDKVEGSVRDKRKAVAYDPKSEADCLFLSVAVYKGKFLVSLPDVYDITESASVLSKAKLVKREPSYIQFTTARKIEFKRALSRLSKLTNIINKKEIVAMFRKVSKVNS